MSQKAMKLALEALEVATTPLARDRQEVLRAITALREALAQQPAQQEPVAWGIIASNTGRICQVELDADEIEGHNPKYIVPLYTSPQAQRTWVGLTEDEILYCVELENPKAIAEEVEAKLKEKNT